MQNSYPDIPVPKIENDLFDVKIYVDSLAQFISECDTPMTIAIQGDWGSGKTSMMNMIREKLGDRVITAWFNTWQFSQFGMSSQLSYSFLSYLTNQICSSDNNQELLKKIKKITFGFARLAAKIAVENTAGGVAADAMDKLSDEGFNYADEIISVKEKFEQGVQDKLTQANKGKDIVQKDRVVVFVDDLDRLPPEIAVELLEVLKLFVDVELHVFHSGRPTLSYSIRSNINTQLTCNTALVSPAKYGNGCHTRKSKFIKRVLCVLNFFGTDDSDYFFHCCPSL